MHLNNVVDSRGPPFKGNLQPHIPSVGKNINIILYQGQITIMYEILDKHMYVDQSYGSTFTID